MTIPRISFVALSLPVFSVLCALSTAAPCRAQASGQDAAYHAALDNLKALEGNLAPAEKAQVPSLEAILHRVFYEYDQATPSEIQLASVIVTGDPNALDDEVASGGKGLNDGPPKLLPLHYHFAPIIALDQKPPHTSSGHPLRHLALSKPRLSTHRQEHYLRPLHDYLVRLSRAGRDVTYRSAVLRQPGGKADGVVEMEHQGQKTKIVEIPTGTGAMGLAERAQRIATRFREVQEKDATWWTRIRPGQKNGEEVVELPGSLAATVPYLVTADQDFAKEWGLTPHDLAIRLVRAIRAGIERRIGGKGVDADARQLAITSKQSGDEAYSANDMESAERRYQQAIDADPSYAPAYKLLVTLYKEETKTDKVQEILGRALGATLSDAELREIQAAAGP